MSKNIWRGSQRFSEYYCRKKVDDRNSNIYPKLLLKNLPENRKTDLLGLDYGCGKGYFTKEMKKMGYHMVCTDPHIKNNSLPKKLRESFVPTKLLSNKLNKLPFVENEFDFVATISVLEHLKKDNTIILLKEFRRITKPDGVILIHIPPYTPMYFFTTIKKKITGYIPLFSGTGNLIQRFFNRRDGDPSHVTWFTPNKLLSFIKAQQFEIVETLPFLLKSRMHKNKTNTISFHLLKRLQIILNRKHHDSRLSILSELTYNILKSILTPLSLGYTTVIKSNRSS